MHSTNHSYTHSFFYFQSIVDSPYLLEPLIDRIASEQSAEVKLQLLTATMKLFFKKPPECQHMLGRLLKFCVGKFNSLFYTILSALESSKKLFSNLNPP